VAIHAQNISSNRKSSAGKRHPLKNKKVFAWVVKRLVRGWSPEQISGRMKLVFKNDLKMRICPETIYSFVYSDKYKYRKFWEYFPRGHKKRRKWHGRKVKTASIVNRISIHDRPKVIDKNTEFGHFEGDSVVGRNHKSGVHTEVERLTRMYFAIKVEAINSEDALKAQTMMFSNLPVKSVTLDNGKENYLHYKLNNLGIQTYFADPYSSWQRGSNEYHNSLLRRYFPKKTDFSKVTQEDINSCVWEINNTPRKCLGYYTPNEVFLSKLNNQRVAIQSRM
jgi:transposase, IS30 family